MGSHRKRRKNRHPSHRPRSRRSAVFSKVKKQKGTDFGFFPFFCLIGVAVVGVYFFYGEKKRVSSSHSVNQGDTMSAVNKRIEKKRMDIQLQQDMQSQRVLSEKFKQPVGKVDPLEPLDSEMSPLDMGVGFSDNASIKSVFEELDEKPFENDIYEDPENVVHRQIAHQDWLEKHLKERNDQEKKEFIRRFVRTAREQGYNVYFKEDLQVILEPIPEEEKDKAGDFEEVKINWK